MRGRVRTWSIALGLILAAALAYVYWRRAPQVPAYVTAEVTRGPVTRAITTTGAVDPVITVEVGAYVSGTIQACYCDYNTQVKAGQLCAKIDPRPYQVVVDQDAANLANAQAQLKKDQASLTYAKISYDRDQNLLGHGIVSRDTVDNDKSTYDQAVAQVKVDESTIQQRQAELHAAQVNLDYTNIISPVDGTVVSRNITIGQTVAASFQTPTLFLIAQDLTKMQVDTNVSETDVGNAKVGQKASFTVEAYPDRTFWGTVSQVREAPITVQNVVTYDVVVSVDNPDFALLPGMTANTRINTDERDDVLRVPLKALRFTPHGAEQAAAHPHAGGEAHGGHGDAAAQERSQERDQERSDADASGGHDRAGGQRKRDAEAGVWVLRDDRPVRVPVVTGLTDTTFAEVSQGDLKPGDRVIVDQVTHEPSEAKGQSPQGAAARPRFRGF
jgi:HlyD family secretion protein